MAFDVPALDAKDLRGRPLHERKRLLARIMPRLECASGWLKVSTVTGRVLPGYMRT